MATTTATSPPALLFLLLLLIGGAPPATKADMPMTVNEEHAAGPRPPAGAPGPLPRPQQPLRRAPAGALPPRLPPLARLSYNAFSGALPDDVARLASLRYLDLTGNAFSGPLPPAFPPTLRFLVLSGNQFSGPVLEGLAAKSPLLLHLNVSGNHLSGSPDFAGALWPLERLRTLDLSHNQFSGPVTDGIARLHNLKTLSLSGNRFGAIPADIGLCPHLSTIDLRHRPDVPAWLGKLAAVQHLDLSDNALTGSLPDSLGDLKALKYLRLSRNQLSGIVPASMSGCTKLAELHLRGNSLSGSIPDALFDVGLETLDVSSNALSGVLPSGSTRLAETLQWLDLSGNKLTGGIPTEMSLFFKLRYLNLSRNDLRAPLPPELGLLRNLTVLDLRSTGLSLGRNGLTGPIPAGISELKKLEILRLEYNNLSGEIPAQLGRLENLLAVNISHNRLVGRLPASGVFQSLDASALEGNLGICSPLVAEPCRMNVPKPLVLDPNEYPHGGAGGGDNNLETNGGGVGAPRKRRFLSVSAMVAICAAVAIVLGVIVITLLNVSARRRAEAAGGGGLGHDQKKEVDESIVTASTTTKSSSSPPPGERASRQARRRQDGDVRSGSSLRSEDLVAGADALLSKATEIGRGAFGTVYRAPVGDGRVVAVKRLVAANTVRSREEFEREVRVLGKARHPNLLPLKGYYWTPQLQLLITDYAAHGSLEARLHGREELPPMTWEERFRVVFGTARALAHLHQAFRPPLVHYNVKPSNIFLLDDECNPAVGDFGLARLLPGKLADGVGSRFHVGGGMGYVAPELACQSLRVNEKCDIYGLGVLILELVTGRRAVEYGDDDVVVLMDQVRVLLEHGNALECVDPGMGGHVPEEEVLPVLKLGMVCTSQIPSNRPSMAEVVQILQVIKAPVGGGGRMEASSF
ncbi:unnamed protein product [Miscanthus lutarioriparius]|uniref:Protein kinase domain-containing protein n=1 Tax=Miscanthus lutarioriparius TaxID=422564 RepID=A0A811NZZ6_9POAL|nr:unnamed protein product [Miscanthus lutarioriparius]